MNKNKHNNRIESNEVIRRLNQEPLIKGDRLYFDCPNCHKPQSELKFNISKITHDYFLHNCFSCNFSGNIFTLAKHLNLFDSNDYTYFNNETEKTKRTEIHTPRINKVSDSKEKPSIELNELKEILELFFSNAPLTEKHKKQYIKKRDSNPDLNNTFSFNPKAYELIKSKYGKEKTEKIFYHYIKKTNEYYLNDCILFTTRDLENNIIHFESKRYKGDKRQRPLRNLGINNKLPVFLNYMNDSIKQVIVCEGVEKAQTINEIFQYKNILAVSIGSIQYHNLLINNIAIESLKGKEIIISFDSKNLEHITLNEEKMAIKLSKKLIDHDLDTYISFLPRPTDPKIKEYDFDTYFYDKDKKFRENAIYDLINNKVREYDIIERFKEYLDKKQDNKSNKRKHNIEYFDVKPDNRVFENLEDYRKGLQPLIESLLYNHKGKVIVFKATTGSGKSYAIAKLMQNYKILFLSHNKELVNEMYSKSSPDNVEIVHSMTDILMNEINNSNLSSTQKDTLIEQVNKLMSKGYGDKAKILIENTLKKIIRYPKPSNNKSLLATHHKAITDNSLLSMSFDFVILDESPDDKVIEKIDINLKEIEHDLEYYKSSHFKDLATLFKDFAEGLTYKELSKINIRKDFIEYLKLKGKSNLFYKRMGRVKFINQKINEIKDISLLPDKTGKIKKLIEAIKNDTLYFNLDDSFVNLKVFSFHTLNKIQTKNTLMILDATADKLILELIGFKVSKFVDIAIKNDNLEILQYPEKTFKTSNILKNDNSRDEFKQLVEKLKTPKTLLFTTKKIVESFEDLNLNIDMAYYGKHDKGVNTFNDNDSTIITPPQVNEKEKISKANLLIGRKIKTYDTHYVFERTGYIEDNKELYIEAYHFKDKYLDHIYQYFLKVPIRQAIGRVTRDYNKKRTVHILSNISLFDYDIRVNKIVYLDKKDLRQEKTIQAEKTLRQLLINSLSKANIIYTETFKSLFSECSKSGNNYPKVPIVNATNHSMFTTSNPVIAQLCKPCYSNIVNNKEFALLLFKEKSIDEIKLYFEQNFDISDRTFETIKKEVFTELKLNSYYLAPSKQGLFYSDNPDLAQQIINEYKSIQNISLNNSSIIEGVNIPSDNLTPENSLLNDNLNGDFKENDIQEDRKENIISEIGPTLTPEKQQDTISYDDYVRLNIDSLNKFVDKYLDNRIEFKRILDSTCFNSLENNYNEALELGRVETAYYYEYLINMISHNFEAYNEYIKDTIEAQQTHIKVLEIKDNHDRELKANLLKLGSNNQTIKKHLNSNEYNKYNSIPIHDKELFLDDLVKGTSKEVIEGKKILYNLIEKLRDKNKERTIRKYISMLIIKNQKLNSTYFNYVNKWVLDAPDIEEFIRRQDLRDFVFKYQHYINVLIS